MPSAHAATHTAAAHAATHATELAGGTGGDEAWREDHLELAVGLIGDVEGHVAVAPALGIDADDTGAHRVEQAEAGQAASRGFRVGRLAGVAPLIGSAARVTPRGMRRPRVASQS